MRKDNETDPSTIRAGKSS